MSAEPAPTPFVFPARLIPAKAERRMDALVTHPLFGYRMNYRRILEIQARLLARES